MRKPISWNNVLTFLPHSSYWLNLKVLEVHSLKHRRETIQDKWGRDGAAIDFERAQQSGSERHD